MTDHNSNHASGAICSSLSRDVQMRVFYLTLKRLDQQLESMRESEGEGAVEAVIDKSRASAFVREVVERELKRREQEEQLFAHVERMAQALSTADNG